MEFDNLNPMSRLETYSTPIANTSVNPKYIEQPKALDDDRSLMGTAIDEAWIISGEDDLERLFTSYEDTGWRATEDMIKQLDDSHDQDQLMALLNAVNEEQYEALLEEFQETNERRAFLGDHGWQGVAAEVGATLLDPVLWGATLSAEFGGIALVGAKASRLARLGRALAAAGVSEAAIAGVRSQTQSDYSERDMAFDMLAALTITGGLELALGKSASVLVKEHGDVQLKETLDTLDAGAAERSVKPESWRIDDYAQRINSGNQEVISFAEAHLQDPVAGGSHSSAVKAERIRANALGKSNKAFAELWDSYKKTENISGLNVVDKARHMNRLSEQVWEAKVMGVDHGPEVAKVAKTLDSSYNDFLGQAEDAGLDGFTREMADPTYMKQEWDRAAWSSLRKEVSEEEFTELINKGLYGFDEDDILARIDELKAALKAGSEEGSEALTKELDELVSVRDARSKLALGFTKRMLDRADGERRSLSELLDDEVSLVEWLKENPAYSHMSEDDVKGFVSTALRSKKRSTDVVDRAKKRIRIDPKASIVTKGGKEVRVADLLNRNAMELHQSYVHSMSGHIAMAENGFKRPSDWKATIDTIKKSEMDRLAGRKDASKKADELAEKIEGDKREIYGLPRYDTSTGTGHRLVNMALKYNFMTAMGKAAFSALSEMGRILGENGVRNTFRSLSALDGLFTDAFRTINKGNHIIREVNEFNASIGDEYLVRLFNSFDETGVLEGTATDGFLSKSEIVAYRGAQLMSKASLLAPVDKGLRLLSFSSSTNSLYRHLLQGKGTRLPFKQMGLTDDILSDIKRNMQAHTSISKTGNVQKLGIEKWDRKTADAFMDAMTTNGARQVQKALAGESVAISGHPFYRIFFQFRKFAIDAYGKHFRADLRDAKSEPLRVLLSTTYATMFAAFGYYGRTLASTSGMDDKDKRKYLKERLEDKRVIANSLQYTPNLGTFITLWNLTGGSMVDGLEVPVSRTTGLSHTFDASSNPTGDKVNRFFSLLSDLNDKEPEDFFRQARPLIPGQNTIPGDILLNTVEQAVD